MIPIDFPHDTAGWLEFATTRADAGLARARELIVDLTDTTATEGTAREAAQVLERWNDLGIVLARVSNEAHLMSESHPDPAVRAGAEARVEAVSALTSEMMLDPALWTVFSSLTEEGLDPESTRLLARTQRDFRRGGVDLPEAQRTRVKELNDRETELSLSFARNIRDGRREITVPVEGLAGMPADFIAAHPVTAEGTVTLTTDYTDLMPIREYCTVAETRRALTAAHQDLAWPANDSVLAELLAVRAELAHLLGKGSWADHETETRMIGSGAAIEEFLATLADASQAATDAEYPILLERLRRDDPEATEVHLSDFWYLLSALKAERFDVDAQEVRSYLPYDAVLEGVLATTARLLDLEYVPVQAHAWHPDVLSYDVLRDGARLGRVHLDMHPREGKYGHAACFGLAPGITDRVLPESVLLCNFSRGLLTHDEVTTFFHEFGHLVHDILAGDQRFVRNSGVATEWDFVEAPSQLLEEWAWDADVLATFTRNEAGDSIPADLVARMQTADGFGRALEVRRQLGHAQVSYHLHTDRPADLQAATEHWYTVTSPVAPMRGRHPYAGFGHLTGYGACYYTYQWSLVIARDLLSAFHEAPGGLMDAEVAARYRREILEPGGSADAADLVGNFLGRDYDFAAYARWLSA